MNDERRPRSRFYDGHVYAALIDPILAGLHRIVIDHVGAACSVLDACCGTGALALRLGALDKEVLGVDLSPRNVALAEKRLRRSASESVRFEIGDVAHLHHLASDAFPVATIVMALHEMPGLYRADVLREVARVATRVVVVDYACPMPKNVTGLLNRAVEFTAGWEHFSGFRDFMKNGGLAPLVEAAELQVQQRRGLNSETLQLWEIRKRP